MIGRVITKSKTLKRQGNQFFKESSLKFEQAIDKFQVIKKFFIIGTLTNLYFCYISYAKYSIYNEIS